MSLFDRLATFGDDSTPRWRLRPTSTFETRPAQVLDPVPGQNLGPLEQRAHLSAPPPHGSFRQSPAGRAVAPMASPAEDTAPAVAERGKGLDGAVGIPAPAALPPPARVPAEQAQGTSPVRTARKLPTDPAGLLPNEDSVPRRPRADPAAAPPVRPQDGLLHQDASTVPAVPGGAAASLVAAATAGPAAAPAPFGRPDPGRDGKGPSSVRADVVPDDPAPTVPLPSPRDLDEAVRAELTRRQLAGRGTRIEYRTPEPPRTPAPRPEGPAELHVHIGRVQVLPPAAPPVHPPRSPAVPPGPSPLTDFLQERARARR